MLPSVSACASEPSNCFTGMKPSRLAVATNLLLDLADQVADVLDAVDIIDERLPDAEWVVMPRGAG